MEIQSSQLACVIGLAQHAAATLLFRSGITADTKGDGSLVTAADCVLTEAGGLVSPLMDLTAQLTYRPSELRNPPFVAWYGNPARREAALKAAA